MSGLRKGRSNQSVFKHLVDKCKLKLIKGGVSGALLTDEDSYMSVVNCLKNRKQRVKVGCNL